LNINKFYKKRMVIIYIIIIYLIIKKNKPHKKIRHIVKVHDWENQALDSIPDSQQLPTTNIQIYKKKK